MSSKSRNSVLKYVDWKLKQKQANLWDLKRWFQVRVVWQKLWHYGNEGELYLSFRTMQTILSGKLNCIKCYLATKKNQKIFINRNSFSMIYFELHWKRKVKSCWRTASGTGLLVGESYPTTRLCVTSKLHDMTLIISGFYCFRMIKHPGHGLPIT